MFIWLFYKLPNPLRPYDSLEDQRHCSPKIHWKSVLLAIYLFGYLHWFVCVSWHTTFAWFSLKLSEWQAAFGINCQDLVNKRSISVTTAFVPILDISFPVNNSQNIQNMDGCHEQCKQILLSARQAIHFHHVSKNRCIFLCFGDTCIFIWVVFSPSMEHSNESQLFFNSFCFLSIFIGSSIFTSEA